ncbi:MAG: hypothetical protein L3J05_02310, partial [Robiginitomaculum sp.]|nr:hypothetical protein [Robiginitomaculum sp.]
GILLMCTLVVRTLALSSEISEEHTKPVQNVLPEKSPDAATTTRTEQASEQQCVTGTALQAVNEKMAIFDTRQQEMAAKESAFKAIEVRLKKQLAAVEAAKASLDESLRYRTSIAKEDILHLTTMYETMKPKQAARIFNEMDPNFAAGFLRKMKGGQAGLILANMKTTQAYKISLIIASKGAKYRDVENRLP